MKAGSYGIRCLFNSQVFVTIYWMQIRKGKYAKPTFMVYQRQGDATMITHEHLIIHQAI